MAIYHCSIKIVSRGKGKSAVAAAAYQAGEIIINDYDGRVHDYTRKGGVVHTEILLPENAPTEYSDRTVLWNAVEKIEKAANSQLAREIEFALPAELTREQNISLAHDYVREHFVSAGMCADICVHDTSGGNPHAHILLTMRPFNEDKSWGIKEKKDYALDENGNRIPVIDETTGLQKLDSRNCKQWKRVYVQANDWNDQAKAEEWRAAWETAANSSLEKHGHDSRIDHRSYARQCVEQIPTVHMGVAATQMERKGIITERGNQNREISRMNQILFAIIAKLKQFKDWLKSAIAPAMPPALASILQSFLEGGGQQNQYGKIRDLKAAARVFAYMQKNGISKMSELREKYEEAHNAQYNASQNVKYYEGRIKTLDENIRQGSIYLKYKDIYSEYKKLKPRKQLKFYEVNRAEITLFEAAQRYFKDKHIGSDFSLKEWKQEQANLPAELAEARREYGAIKTQFSEVENVRLDVEQIVRDLNRPQQQRSTKNRGMER